MTQVKALNERGSQIDVVYDVDPSQCPICHHSIVPVKLAPHVVSGPSGSAKMLEIVFRCPRPECARLFIGQYAHVGGNNYEHMRSLPKNPEPAAFETEIGELSPTFILIYNQALAAESAGLNEISGVGLRKAFEFLIKDYCIKKHSDKEEEIKSKLLGRCIQEYIEDPKLKSCAERAVWLGNDETHYLRKWEEHDINDLKLLIRLSVNWMMSELLTEKYLSEM